MNDNQLFLPRIVHAIRADAIVEMTTKKLPRNRIHHCAGVFYKYSMYNIYKTFIPVLTEKLQQN